MRIDSLINRPLGLLRFYAAGTCSSRARCGPRAAVHGANARGRQRRTQKLRPLGGIPEASGRGR